MNNTIDNQHSFSALQEALRMGLWCINVPQNTITFSSFLADLLQIKSCHIPVDDFFRSLQTVHKETLLSLDELMLHPDNYNEYFHITTPDHNSQFIQFKTSRIFVNKNNEKILEGSIQCVKEEDISSREDSYAEIHLNHLLKWQRSISHTLLGLLNDSSDDQTIPYLLNLIRENFGGSGAHIFSYSPKTQIFDCAYESVAPGMPPLIHLLQNMQLSEEQCLAPILDKKPVFKKAELDHKPTEKIDICNTHSMMASPLLSKEDIWGLIQVESPDPDREWTPLEQELFIAVSNIIGVCLALNRSKDYAVQNSDFLHKLYGNMPLGYFRLNIELNEEGLVTDYEYLDINGKFTEMCGKSREELVGKMHSEIGPIFVKKLDVQLLAGVAYEGKVLETIGQMRYDQRFYSTTIYSPCRGDIVALFSDITDTILTTEALRKNEEELSKLYKNIPVGIEIYDKDGYMTEVNDQEVKILGVPNKEVLLGLNIFEHPSLPKHAYDLLKEGKDVTFDVDMQAMTDNRAYYGEASKDMYCYLTIKCTILFNTQGELENYLLIIIDNTQIYNTSARLREFESAFKSVAEIAEVGFFRWNPLTNTYSASEQFYLNMGIDLKKPLPPIFEECCGSIHPDDYKPLTDFIENSTKGLLNSLTYELRVRNGKDWKWLRATYYVTEYDPDRQVLQIIGLNYNIDEIKKTERKLIEAKAKAEESDRLKSAFIANMSHEIRTPLNAIIGFTDVLAESSDPEEKQQFISIIKKNNDHLLNLISSILDLSALESGGIEPSFSDILVNELCEQETNTLFLKAPNNVDLRFINTNGLKSPILRSDAKLVAQVLSSLLNNAIKFTSKGHIWLSYKILDNEIEFSVEDTGIGMEEGSDLHIFDRFVKLNDFIPGTGLGLTICKSIVEKLEGNIGVESTKGVGSRFWFTLPITNGQ